MDLSEHAAEPLPVDGFEHVVEFSVETPNGLAVVDSPGENWRTISRRAGGLRVRVHMRGMDAVGRAQDDAVPAADANVVLEGYAIQDGVEETEERTAARITAGNGIGSAQRQPVAAQDAVVTARVLPAGCTAQGDATVQQRVHVARWNDTPR